MDGKRPRYSAVIVSDNTFSSGKLHVYNGVLFYVSVLRAISIMLSRLMNNFV